MLYSDKYKLTIHYLEIVMEAATPLALDSYCGSALRGAFFRSLWGRFCTNRESLTCEACPLVTACPVASLVAPLRDEASHGQNVPRPYIITPPYDGKMRYERSESFAFGLALIGTIAKLYPYVMRAFQEMEQNNLGHPLTELQGRRGKILVREVYEYHPITGERQLLWQRGEKRPASLSLCVTSADIAVRASQLPTDRLVVNFLSPTRLVANEHLMRTPDFLTLILRLALRLEQVLQEYGVNAEAGDAIFEGDREGYLLLKEKAASIRLEHDETRWEDIRSYSSRQKRQLPMGGLVGRATFVGDMRPFRELLAWGELLRIGKNIVKGGGAYRIEV